MSDQSQNPPNETSSVRELREAYERSQEAAREANARADQNAAAARELVFVKAGIKDDPMGLYFQQTYNGDLTEEAVKAAAEPLGLLKGDETKPGTEGEGKEKEPVTQPTEEQLREQRERAALGAQHEPPGEMTPEHPGEAGLNQFFKSLSEGETRDRAAAQYFDRVVDARVKGDERVIWTPEKQRQLAAEDGR